MADDYNEDQVGIPYLTGPADFVGERPVPSRWTTCDDAVANAGDILVTVKGAGIGKLAIADADRTYISRQLMAVRPIGVLSRFLVTVLYTLADQLRSQQVGIAIPGIGRDDLLQALVLLPPLAEQRRIVAKVDELMGLLDELEQARDEREARRAAFRDSALAALQNAEDAQAAHAAWTRIATNLADCLTDPADIAPLRQTILQLAVRGRLVPQDATEGLAAELQAQIDKGVSALVKSGSIRAPKLAEPIAEHERIHDLPRNWLLLRLGTIAGLINGDRGKQYPSKDDFVDSGVAFINAGHLRDGRVSFAEMNYITEERFESLRSGKVQFNDILYCLRGSLGKSGIVVSDHTGAIASSLLIIRSPDGVLPNYLLSVLASPYGAALIRRFDNGSAQPNLAAGNVSRYPIPLPPLAEQRRIVARIDALMAICDELEQQLNEAKAHQSAFAAAAVHHLDLTPDLSAPLPDDPDPWPQPTPEQIDRVLAHLPDLHGDRARLAADRLWQDLEPNKLFVPFNWNAWKVGHAIVNMKPGWQASVARADTKTIQRLFTTTIRANAFCEGVWDDAVRGGLITAMLQRLAEIRESMEPSESTAV
jgi:restriction endonuclease S subunit